MIDDQLVKDALAAPEGWDDTPEQAQLRACLVTVLSGHDPVQAVIVSQDLITLIRNHFLTDLAYVRRQAAKSAKVDLGMSVVELATTTKQTPATIERLLAEASTKSRS
jgi:hypothetical protein